jgi:energy-coupling factor transport system permease protein
VRSRIAFRPGNSVLHRLHPLMKAVWLLFATVFLFVAGSPWPVVVMVALLLGTFPLVGLPLTEIRGTRLFTSTALLLGLLQVAFVHDGTIWIVVGPLPITQGGLEAGVYVAGRFLGVILLSYLFVLTTEPNDLAYALMQTGLPYRYGFALITALRLVPTFEQEGQTVYQAQLARGVEYDVRSPRRFLMLARQFVLPLLVSALGKVDALAVSLEGRCFGKYPTRTFVRHVHATRLDAWSLALLMLATAGTAAGLLIR